MYTLYFFGTFFSCTSAFAQQVDSDLLAIKERLDAIIAYQADMSLDIHADFIKMPTKYATVTYTKDQPLQFSSDDFILIPKKGLDVTMSQLFEHPFITVNRGFEKQNGKTYKVVNVIPNDDKSDYSIAKIVMDTVMTRIVSTEIHTKKEGSFTLQMTYSDKTTILPEQLEIFFEMERLRLPFNFLGKNAEIDRKKMRSQESQSGSIILMFKDYKIKYGSSVSR
ncbi:hypothetical protein J0X14_10525 [Muricauda sp. CAU 1633]|nr:hypothetical protein [Muricauda sp. CAU 1633]